MTRAILSHADYSGVPRESRLEHTLFACDEMAGFVTAAALVRPSKSVLDLEAASVIKRMKDKAFARAVPREDLRRGAEELGPAARRAHRQRDRVHARAGRRAGASRLPLVMRRNSRTAIQISVYSKRPDMDTAVTAAPLDAAVGAPVVELDGVTVVYGTNPALKDVTARFARGAVGLLGPNGAGKSTMLKALLGFVAPDARPHARARPRRRRSAARRSARASATCRRATRTSPA